MAIIYHCTKSASAVLPGTLVYKRRTSQNKGLGGESASVTSGRSYKASRSIYYDSKVILTSKLLIFTTLETLITIVCAL